MIGQEVLEARGNDDDDILDKEPLGYTSTINSECNNYDLTGPLACIFFQARYYYHSCIVFSFYFQAILFYIPRWLWKNWEAGKIQALMMDLDLGIISEVEKRQKKKLLLDYLYSNLKNHNFWAYRYFFCELLALINVIGMFSTRYH